jgi:hypothetical protein
MPSLLEVILGEAAGLLLWSFLNALVLQWRARKVKSWRIDYKSAHLLSLKAGSVALLAGDAVVLVGDTGIFAMASAGIVRAEHLPYIGVIVGVFTWRYLHSNLLMTLAGSSISLALDEARTISAVVFGYLFGMVVALSIVLMLLFSLTSAFK